MALIRTAFLTLTLLSALIAHADDASDIQKHLKSGNPAEALKVADQALASKPKDPQLRFLRGVSLTELNRGGEAITTFVKLTEDFPELPEPFNNLAVLYAGQGQYDKARSALEMAIRTNPSYGTAYENLGDVYAKLASQAYAKALQIDGANQAVPPKLGLIRDLFSPRSASAEANASQRGVASSKPATTPPPATPAPSAPPVVASVAQTESAATAASASASTPIASPPPETEAPSKPVAEPAVKPPTASEPASTATPASAAPARASLSSAAEADITKSVHAWAQAWSRRDMKAYFAAYAKDFEAGKARSEWEAERKSRIVNRSAISVKVTDIKIKPVDNYTAEVEFHQNYESGSIKSSSLKTLLMVRTGSRWLIQKEISSP